MLVETPTNTVTCTLRHRAREHSQREGRGRDSPDVVVGEGGVEHLEVGVVDVLEHQAGCLALGVSDDV